MRLGLLIGKVKMENVHVLDVQQVEEFEKNFGMIEKSLTLRLIKFKLRLG